MVEVKRKKIHGVPTLLYRFKGGYAFDSAAATQLAAIDKSLFLPFSFDTTPKGTPEISFDISRMASFGDWAKDAHGADEISCLCRDVARAVDSCIKAGLPLKNVEFGADAVFYDSWMQAFRFIYLPVEGIEPDVSKMRTFVLDALGRLTPADDEAQRTKDRLIAAVGAKETEYDPLMVAKILRKESLGKSVLDDIARPSGQTGASSAARADLRASVPPVAEPCVQPVTPVGFEVAGAVENADAACSASAVCGAGTVEDAGEDAGVDTTEEMPAVDADCAFRRGGTIVLGLMEQEDDAPGTIVLGLTDDEEAPETASQVEEPGSQEAQGFRQQETPAASAETQEAEEAVASQKTEGQDGDCNESQTSGVIGKHAKDETTKPQTLQDDVFAAGENTESAADQKFNEAFEPVETTGDTEASDPAENDETEDSEGQTTLLWSEPALVFSLVRAKTKERIFIPEGRLVVGKSVHSDYRVAGNTTVSRLHAVFDRKDDACHVEDNKSLNGTFVNGAKLAPATRVKLSNGDVIRLSDEDFLFEVSDQKEGE